MDITLPKYNGNDNLVMILVMLPFCFICNCIIFGTTYFSSIGVFLTTTALTGIMAGLEFITCGVIAVTLKKRFPHESQLLKRLALMICIFLLLSGLFLYALFEIYELIPFLHYHFDETAFTWSYFTLGIINIFITFLMEGISRFKDWRANWMETRQLNDSYQQTRLNGLKSQVNPHFLFNSLNSLSSLIQEDSEKAERFLDEMSKVYRYMLRNDEEDLVSLATELEFTNSYIHILKARYGNGISLEINALPHHQVMLLAPLTLQVIIENAFSLNVISKSSPLKMSISVSNNMLLIKNNIQPRSVNDTAEMETGLDNLVKKYELLNMPVQVEENHGHRIIHIPLAPPKNPVAHETV